MTLRAIAIALFAGLLVISQASAAACPMDMADRAPAQPQPLSFEQAETHGDCHSNASANHDNGEMPAAAHGDTLCDLKCTFCSATHSLAASDLLASYAIFPAEQPGFSPSLNTQLTLSPLIRPPIFA